MPKNKSSFTLQSLISFLQNQWVLMVGLLLEILIRIPTFFDPYWYGDEAIYLTVGNGIAKGLKLYTDIIDHKTPLIYYLATVPDQLSFRFLMFGWMLITTVAVNGILKKITSISWVRAVGLWFFVILTGIPWFEGHIPNGELFVMGFVLVGLWLLTLTPYFSFLESERFSTKTRVKDWMIYGLAGFFFGLGILTKVPALLDLGSMMIIGWFTFSRLVLENFKSISVTKIWSKLKYLWPSLLILFGSIIAIAASIIYFVSVGSGKDYLDYGLLYNFRYSGSWKLDLNPAWLETFFTLPVKTLLLGGWIIGLSLLAKFITPKTQWLLGWFGLALYATLLSNRPYPHYFQQVLPALALLIASNLDSIATIWRADTVKSNLVSIRRTILGLGLTILIIWIWISIMLLMKVGLYGVTGYYSQFAKYISGSISKTDYEHSFNWLIPENEKLSSLIKIAKAERIFIWGTDPMLYAMTKTIPTSRFTVSFHIEDFKDYERTLNQIIKDQPKLILVMKDAPDFPGLNQYLQQNYLRNSTNYEHFEVYVRLDIASQIK